VSLSNTKRADGSTDEEIVGLLEADLRLTMAYLRSHPKVYWIWTHRKWCLENVPRGPGDSEGWRNEFWKKEIGLVEKLLDADARNCEFRHWLEEDCTCQAPRSALWLVVADASPCLDLPAVYQRVAPRVLHASAHARRRDQVHDEEDRVQLLQLLRVALAHQEPAQDLGGAVRGRSCG
jgi:hypothetical protein